MADNSLLREAAVPGAHSDPIVERPTRRLGHQQWCTADVPEGAQTCPTCKSWQPGNVAALVHGARRSLNRPDALAAMAEKRAELVAHLGDRPSVVQTDLASDYSKVDCLIESVTETIEASGPLTPKGRMRAASTLLLQLMDRRLRLALTLGIERRTPRVDTPSDALMAAPIVGGRDADR